jgi:flagellum-specific peptidoglycan hydrolase FlgJ
MPWYASDDLLDEVGGMRFKNAAQSMLDDFKRGLTGSSSSSPSSDAATPTPAPPPAPEPVQQPLLSASAPSVDTTSTGRATDQQPGSFLPTEADLTAGWGAPAGTSAATGSSGASGSQSTPSSTADPGQPDANKSGSFLPTMDALAGGWMHLLPPKDQATVAQATGMTPAQKLAPLTPSGTPAPMPSDADRRSPQLSTGQRADITIAGGPPAISGDDRASRIASALPIARSVEARTGMPAGVNLAFAVHESGLEDRYGPGMSYHGRHAVGDEPGTPITDWGYDANGNRVDYSTKLKRYDTPAGSFEDFADLITHSPRYAGAWQTYQQTGDKGQLIRDIWAAGYGESKTGPAETVDIMNGQIKPIEQQAPRQPASVQIDGGPPSGPPKPPGPVGIAAGKDWRQTWGDNLTPDQIKETLALGLDWNAAIATCGIAAAVAFARANGGEPPTFGQALDLAQRSGEWNAAVGMTHGTPGEISVLKQLGVDAHQGPLDERSVAQAVQAGQPVQINAKGNGGHFYVAQKYDPESHRFDFGGSTAILKAAGGRTWFRLDELPALGVGTPSEAIYLGAGQ